MKTKFLLSIVAASLLLSGCGSSSDNNDNNNNSASVTTTSATTNTTTNTSRAIKGSVVDGYVSGATVQIGDYTTTTDANGSYIIPASVDTTDATITAFGGIDIATGERFEGILKAPYEKNASTISLTPLTTLIAAAVENGATPEEAKTKIAQQLGLSVDTLSADPIAQLKSNTPEKKEEAKKALKLALTVQKMAETLSSAVSTTDEEKDKVYSQVMKAVADDLQSKKIDDIIKDPQTLAQKTAIFLEKDSLPITDHKEKLLAASDATATVARSIQDMNLTDLTTASNKDIDKLIRQKSKAIEVATAAVEKAVSDLSQSTDINDTEDKIRKTRQTLIMFGGIDGIGKSIKTEEKIHTNKDFDSSEFSEKLFSQENIDTQSAEYSNLKNYSLKKETIAEIAKRINNDGNNTADIIKIIEQTLQEKNPDAYVHKDEIATHYEDAMRKKAGSMQDSFEISSKPFNTTEEASNSQKVTEILTTMKENKTDEHSKKAENSSTMDMTKFTDVSDSMKESTDTHSEKVSQAATKLKENTSAKDAKKVTKIIDDIKESTDAHSKKVSEAAKKLKENTSTKDAQKVTQTIVTPPLAPATGL